MSRPRSEFPVEDDAPRIAPPAATTVSLRGSHPMPAVRRRRDGDLPDPDGEAPSPEPPAPPAVSVPDFALQFLGPPPSEQDQLEIVEDLRRALGSQSDIRLRADIGSTRIAIWLRTPPVLTADVNQARERGVAQLDLVRKGEGFGFFLNVGLVRRIAFDAWLRAPKRLDAEGRPDANGPINLTAFALDFVAPNRVVMRVDGFDERPWPDVNFTVVTTDTITASAGTLVAETDTDLIVDRDQHLALGFLLSLAGIVGPTPLFFLGAVFVVQGLIVTLAPDPDLGQGAGARALELVPKEIMIPDGFKYIPYYTRGEVSGGGIFAGGVADRVQRTPTLTIQGERDIAIPEGASEITRTFQIIPEDLRPTLTVRWSADGAVRAPTSAATAIRFAVGNAKPGEVLGRRVAVRVRDEDGLEADAHILVRLHVRRPEQEDDGLPAICRLRPWLPQCQVPLARLAEREEFSRPAP